MFFSALLPAAFAQSQPKPVPVSASRGAVLTYRKVFKASYPEYVEIKVNEEGRGTWDIRQLDETASPQPLEINPALAQRLFQLAAALHDFEGVDLEVHRRIAYLGEKTFRYQKGAESHEVSFNYTVNSDANQLLAVFDGLARQEVDLSDLQRSMRYDPLGINDVVLRVAADVKNKLLPDPGALLPVLERISNDSDLVDIARHRARAIAEQIRSGH